MRRRAYRRHHRAGTTLNACTDMGRKLWKVLAKTEVVSVLKHWIGQIA
jgi:hypothetical protein